MLATIPTCWLNLWDNAWGSPVKGCTGTFCRSGTRGSVSESGLSSFLGLGCRVRLCAAVTSGVQKSRLVVCAGTGVLASGVVASVSGFLSSGKSSAGSIWILSGLVLIIISCSDSSDSGGCLLSGSLKYSSSRSSSRTGVGGWNR